jgi:hypothetical protein
LGRVSRFYFQAPSREEELLAAGMSASGAEEGQNCWPDSIASVCSVNLRRMVGSEEQGASMSGANGILLLSLVGVFGNFVLIYRGINKGIEAFAGWRCRCGRARRDRWFAC